MKRQALTLAIVALSVLAFGQKKDSNTMYSLGKHSIVTSKDSTFLKTDSVYVFKSIGLISSIIFTSIEGKIILEFKSNGDIIYKGKKLDTDTAIVKGLREALTGKRRVK